MFHKYHTVLKLSHILSSASEIHYTGQVNATNSPKIVSGEQERNLAYTGLVTNYMYADNRTCM